MISKTLIFWFFLLLRPLLLLFTQCSYKMDPPKSASTKSASASPGVKRALEEGESSPGGKKTRTDVTTVTALDTVFPDYKKKTNTAKDKNKIRFRFRPRPIPNTQETLEADLKKTRAALEKLYPAFTRVTIDKLRISVLDVLVYIYWDVDNCPVPKKFDLTRLAKIFRDALQSLRKELDIYKIFVIGDLSQRFDDQQRTYLFSDPLFVVIDLPCVDRRTDRVKHTDHEENLTRYILKNNPSLTFESSPTSLDGIHSDSRQQFVAKYFLTKYFANRESPSALSDPAKHLKDFEKNTPIDPLQCIPPTGLPDNRSKTDMADMKLVEKMFLNVIDHGGPSIIMFISSDNDFASSLSALKERGHLILLVSTRDATKLESAVNVKWSWTGVRSGLGYDSIV